MSHDPGMTLEHWLLWHWLPWQAVPSLIVVVLVAVAVGAAVSWLIRRRSEGQGSP
jgi:MFS superfamily sulfate permease-like transporter